MRGEAPLEPTSAQSIAELVEIAGAYSRLVGCEYFSYLITRPPRQGSIEDDIFISSYPEEWNERYLSKTYKLYDPVVQLSRKTRLPYFWGQRGFLRAYNKNERYVFHEAGEFGINEGYTVPVAGPDFDSAIFSIISRERNAIGEVVHEKLGDLQLFAAKFHDTAIRLIDANATSDDIGLTPREIEVLTWTAEGYSNEAVAARLGLSLSAINYHIANCCRKLDTGNKVQAVARAIRMGII